jgi:hypothetical protein
VVTDSGAPRRFDHLREHSIGLPQVLFQSITHMAPAAAEDAFIFLSVACDAGVAQACKPVAGDFGTIARFAIPKIDACPAPFRQ